MPRKTKLPKPKGRMLWAVKIGDPDWAEQIITTDESRIEAATTWAKSKGFHRFRIANYYHGEFPDFASTINIKGRQ